MIFTFKNLSYLRLNYTRNAQNPPKYGILIKFSRNLGYMDLTTTHGLSDITRKQPN